MSFVPHVRDAFVTDLVYVHMPSWFAVACYFDWRKHYAAEQLRRELMANPAKYRRLHAAGAVLTENGWVIPTGPENPRILEEPGDALITAEDAALQARNDAEVAQAREDHEAAVLYEDMAIFSMQWRATVDGSKRAAGQVRKAQARSEEREAFMARWIVEHGPR